MEDILRQEIEQRFEVMLEQDRENAKEISRRERQEIEKEFEERFRKERHQIEERFEERLRRVAEKTEEQLTLQFEQRLEEKQETERLRNDLQSFEERFQVFQSELLGLVASKDQEISKLKELLSGKVTYNDSSLSLLSQESLLSSRDQDISAMALLLSEQEGKLKALEDLDKILNGGL